MLFQAFLWLSYICNLNCKHCYAKTVKNNKSFSIDFVKSLIDDLYDLWVIKIVLSHGEPLAYPYIQEALTYMKEKWFYVVMMSNGILLTQEKITFLEKVWLDKIYISLDSCDPNIYDDFRGVKWSFQKVMACFDLLWKSKLKRAVSSTISELNKNELEDVIDFAISKWAHEISMLTIRDNKSYTWLLPYAEYRDLIVKLWQSYKKNYSNRINLLFHDKYIYSFLEEYLYWEEKEKVKNQNECVAWKKRITIAPDWNVYPCTFVFQKMWNVFEKSVKDIYEESKYNQFKTCITCKL